MISTLVGLANEHKARLVPSKPAVEMNQVKAKT